MHLFYSIFQMTVETKCDKMISSFIQQNKIAVNYVNIKRNTYYKYIKNYYYLRKARQYR